MLYLPYIVEYLLAVMNESNLYYKLLIKKNKNKVKKMTKKNKSHEDINKIILKIDKLQTQMEIAEKRYNNRKENPYKIIFRKESAVKYLIIVMIICIFTGFLTPLGTTPFTYLPKTLVGNTMNNIIRPARRLKGEVYGRH